MLEGILCQRDAAWRRPVLQPGRNVDRGAVNISIGDVHIAMIDGDTKCHRRHGRAGGRPCGALHGLSPCECVSHRREVRHHAIAGGFDNCAAMLPPQRPQGAVEQFHPPKMRGIAFGAHENRIADDVGECHRGGLTPVAVGETADGRPLCSCLRFRLARHN